jgi:prepilin-type N-terminal cleavage/methylation domain-containing protein
MITNEPSQNAICHSEGSEESLIRGAQTLRVAEGESFETVSSSGGIRGFTLIEALLAMTVLGFAAAGVLLPFAGGAAARAEGVHRSLGAELAANLMEQVIKAPFSDIVTNYNYSESQGKVIDITTGLAFTDPKYTNFSRKVTSVYVTVKPQPAQSDPTKCNFILVTVQVDYSGRNVATLSRLVSE